jgi:cytochrome c oxidase subunit 3
MWVIPAAIAMMFGNSGAYIYIIASTGEQRQPPQCRPCSVSTGIILASSWTLERAKRSLHLAQSQGYIKWLVSTLVLGLAFLGSQLVGWRELARAGVYFAGHPHSSFFYFFTGVHGAHLLGGIVLLSYLLLRTRNFALAIDSERNLAWAAVVRLYWHAMDAIWIWLFLLLLILK